MSPHWAYVWGYSYRKTTLATWSSSCTSADEVYFNCCASLNDADKSMWYVQAFWTDGDTNLSDALSHCFPFAQFVISSTLSIICMKITWAQYSKVDRWIYQRCHGNSGNTRRVWLIILVSEFDKQQARLEDWNEQVIQLLTLNFSTTLSSTKLMFATTCSNEFEKLLVWAHFQYSLLTWVICSTM